MQQLFEAASTGRSIRLHSGRGTSVAALLPVKRSHASVALGLDEKRYLRVAKSGKVDFEGGKNGPWTEFNATLDNDDDALILQSAKTGRWLTVANGEIVSSDTPESLTLQFCEKVEAAKDDSASARLRQLGGAVVEKREAANNNSAITRLRQLGSTVALPWLLQLRSKGNNVILETQDGNVACGEQGHFHNRGKEGKWAQWKMKHEGGGMSLVNLGHDKYLAIDFRGTPVLAEIPTIFELESCGVNVLAANMPSVDQSVLNLDALQIFKQRGYVIVREAVPAEIVRDALRSINHQLGTPGCWEADPNPLNAAQLSLKLPKTGIGKDVFDKSPRFWSAVNILLGTGNVEPWDQSQQIALRFPQPPHRGIEVPDRRPGTRYHIDGMGQNRLCPFSLLCGVALSDQTRPEMGNLHVFPGSHLNVELHKYYSEKINDVDQNEADENKPDLGEATQVLLRPGDVVIAHQLLAHRVGQNTSEHIRYQLYYRVKHKDHAILKERIVADPWVEFAV